MKKGFTMIELIFVIVILGILASVAVPRLAGTKADAEESAAVANLRTLVNDANVYYVTKGDLKKKGSATENAKWSDITSVPLVSTDDTKTAVDTAATAHLKAGGKNCISLYLKEKDGDVPAHIVFTGVGTDTTCAKVKEAPSVKAYLDSTLPGSTEAGKMPIGSTAKIY